MTTHLHMVPSSDGVLLNMWKFSLTVNIESCCVNHRSQRVGCFASVQTAILNPSGAYVHVADDVTGLINILTDCVSVAHARRCKQFSVQIPRELGRRTASGGAVQRNGRPGSQDLLDERGL